MHSAPALRLWATESVPGPTAHLAVHKGTSDHVQDGGGQTPDAVEDDGRLRGADVLHTPRESPQDLHHGLRAGERVHSEHVRCAAGSGWAGCRRRGREQNGPSVLPTAELSPAEPPATRWKRKNSWNPHPHVKNYARHPARCPAVTGRACALRSSLSFRSLGGYSAWNCTEIQNLGSCIHTCDSVSEPPSPGPTHRKQAH